MEISIDIQQKGGYEVVTYSGPINEESEVHLAKLASGLGSKVILNLSHVEYVNSCGVRGWINFMRELQKGREIIFEECTSEVVMQINMIPSFRGNAKVKSVYATFSCDSCGQQTNILFEDGKNLPDPDDIDVDSPSCGKCGEDMEMLEIEDEFFAFLAA